ncbi:TetR/AcrR family transcriptional regulator [Novosphingobium decolorationis]|uniref:TetR/AcrR family transcriptional regulator n=1 Tax=Novosphingobium decolorationis TaxID=2698673 RepID=A0ABX8E2G2_9SPHN|nr:TetR/AcrR family transcriptional regulator [Novosphingobium decolorationis]QVM83317.1 TetR/AcrR family transcriptional regulator [Novosphingobium decolorationis]
MDQNIGKRERNKARKRAEIVEAARESFLEQGYAATSMSAVADALSCSKATMWSHFASKEELFAAVIDDLVGQFSQEIDEVLTRQTFSCPALRRACLRFLDCLLTEHSIRLFRLVLSEGERFPEINEMFYTRGPAKVRREVHRFFATAFCEDDAQRLTTVVTWAMTGFRTDILLRPVKPDGAECEAFVDDLIASIDWDRLSTHQSNT